MTVTDTADAPQQSLRRLNKAVLLATAVAAVIVGTVVLPAEYGIDPAGVGRVFGLTQMGEMKAAQVGGGAVSGPMAGDSVTTEPDGSMRVKIVIGPYGGREVKAFMTAGAQMTYEWSTEGEPVEFEFHGDPNNPKEPGEYKSYEKGTNSKAAGQFTAGFSGRHGWFWKNTSAQPVTITATVRGAVDKFTPLYAEGENASTTKVGAAGTAGSGDKTPYHIAMPMRELMTQVISGSAQKIWDRQGYISDEKGFRSLFPRSNKEWKDAENEANQLAEFTNILLLPGRRVEEQAWTDAVVKTRMAALKLAELSRKKNEDEFMAAGVDLNDGCAACHQKYAPGVN